MIGSFTATPSTAVPGTPTSVTWSWSFSEEPSPDAECSIAGIGNVTNGERTVVTLVSNATFELTCRNEKGVDHAATTVLAINAPGAPIITHFTATPDRAVFNLPTQVRFAWTLADGAVDPTTCSIDQGIGQVSDGVALRTIAIPEETTYTLTCINASGVATAQLAVWPVSAPIAPTIDSFTANPGSVVGGAATSVTFDWSFANVPTPWPRCGIDRGIGPIEPGESRTVTLAADTTYTLTCTNDAGSRSKQLAMPVVYAPSLVTFGATPSSVTSGVASTITWNWSYSTPPIPDATCTIDHGVGIVAPGSTSNVMLAADTVYTLTCTNSVGTSTRQLTVAATPPAPPSIGTFVITPSTVFAGIATSVTFDWTYSNTPVPLPTCTIDQNIGTITANTSRTITLNADTTFTLTCTNIGGSGTSQRTVTITPAVAPQLATFEASPSAVLQNATTSVRWAWTYANTPSPTPTCAIDQGIGDVTSGASTFVNQGADRTYTLTCTNAAGSASISTTIRIAVAPEIVNFSATPTLVPANTTTTVFWNWGYAIAPYPVPTCSIEHFVGPVAQGSGYGVAQRGSRTYRLTCSNLAGFSTADATINVDECASGIATCDPNAQCTDTQYAYDCQCNAGFAGDGATCSKLAACNADPSVCHPQATCVNTSSGFACTCPLGYVGDGITCTRLPISFLTSTRGTGDLSTWPEANGLTGLAAGDAICQARAATAGFPGTYIAWLSDDTTAAYCRIHGLLGTTSNQCGQSQSPANAGPWVRPDGLPFMSKLVVGAETTVFYSGSLDENNNVDVYSFAPVFTGSWLINYSLGDPNQTCSSWTTYNAGATTGLIHGGDGYWSDYKVQSCGQQGHLRCMELASGPELPPLRPVAKRVFVTSGATVGRIREQLGTSQLTGIAAADAMCQRHARFGGLENSERYKAFLGTTTQGAAARLLSNGPWARLDGVIVADGPTDLRNKSLHAAINVDERGHHIQLRDANDGVWTGTVLVSNVQPACANWTAESGTAMGGIFATADPSAADYYIMNCGALLRLYCFED